MAVVGWERVLSRDTGGCYVRCGGRSLREGWRAGEYARDERQVLCDGWEMNFTPGLSAM